MNQMHDHAIKRYPGITRRRAGTVMDGWRRVAREGNYIVYQHPMRKTWFITRWFNNTTGMWEGWVVRNGEPYGPVVTWDTHLELCQIWVQAQPLWLQQKEVPA